MPHFARYIAVDYSGAATADQRLPGLRIVTAVDDRPPVELRPADGRHWSRRLLAAQLLTLLAEQRPTCLGIDHGFGFPQAYLDAYRLPNDRSAQLTDFVTHWPTDAPGVTVRALRDGRIGNAAARRGDARWRRLCERRCRAKSIFHFDVPGSVAASTHAGLPWLHDLQQQLGSRLHCWPFDGLLPSAGCSLAAEIYPSLWSTTLPRAGRSPDQHDAYVSCLMLQQADRDGRLSAWLQPQLSPAEHDLMRREGWILGVV